ncbi:DNA-repair protein complementing XP-A cells [Nematocida sp. AWRm80]|nr:DNA-repair protein complementing XP-A cells [Nematocida sp. AWRm80]
MHQPTTLPEDTSIYSNNDNIKVIYTDNTTEIGSITHDIYVCSKCNGNGVINTLYKAFQVYLCHQCKDTLPLVTQTIAIKEYLLSKSDLNTLPKLERRNPLSTMWKPMLLYREDQVKELSQRKFPCILSELRRRQEVLIARRDKRASKKLKLLKAIIRPKSPKEHSHSHSFDSSGLCSCGLSVELEEL